MTKQKTDEEILQAEFDKVYAKVVEKEKTPEDIEREEKLVEQVEKAKTREEKWRLAADAAREINPYIKAEQDYQIQACADVRRLKLYKKEKTKKAGLRFAVSIPPMTFNVLSVVDPDLRNIDKSDYMTKDATNEIVRALERTFPEYRVS